MANRPRLPRFLLAGLLLYAATLAVAWPHPGWAAAAFVPLWYAIAVVNGWLGVVSVGYRVRDEAVAFAPVFGVPAAVAGLMAWLFAGARWPVAGVRFWLVLLGGVALWAAVVLLIGLLAPTPTVSGALGPAVLVFVPLWTMCCVGNLVAGVGSGYRVAEEILVLLLNLVVPAAVAVGVWRWRRTPNR